MQRQTIALRHYDADNQDTPLFTHWSAGAIPRIGESFVCIAGDEQSEREYRITDVRWCTKEPYDHLRHVEVLGVLE